MDRRTFLKVVGAGVAAVSQGVPSAFAQVTSATGDRIASGSATATSGAKPLFSGKLLVAHRGASAYLPEHTLPAYRLAIEQGADLVEQDLHITKDGVLVCIHDGSLHATTDVEEVFPDRFTISKVKGKDEKTWMVSDFTLAEIRQLKAGFRDDRKSTPAPIPTWQEAIDEIRGKAGLCPETKSADYYTKLGFDMEKLVAEVLRKNGLDKADADSRTPVLMQSFSRESIARLAANGIQLPMIWLQFKESKTLAAAVAEGRQLGYVGLGPHKDDVTAEFVKSAHAAGLKVIPYTYDPQRVKEGYVDVKAEMSHHLHDLGIEGLFTNNPDLFPRSSIKS